MSVRQIALVIFLAQNTSLFGLFLPVKVCWTSSHRSQLVQWEPGICPRCVHDGEVYCDKWWCHLQTHQVCHLFHGHALISVLSSVFPVLLWLISSFPLSQTSVSFEFLVSMFSVQAAANTDFHIKHFHQETLFSKTFKVPFFLEHLNISAFISLLLFCQSQYPACVFYDLHKL